MFFFLRVWSRAADLQREQEELNALIHAAQIAKHAPRPIEALRGVTGSGSTASLNRVLAAVAAEAHPPRAEKATPLSPRKSKTEPNEEALAGEDELRASLQALALRDLVKVVPERIYCLLVHPSTTKDLVIIGDKKGHIGVWDATEVGRKPAAVPNGAIRSTGGTDAEEDEDAKATFWHWKGHSGTISSLRFPPVGTAGSNVGLPPGCCLRGVERVLTF